MKTNGYKVSKTKMTSRYGVSVRERRDWIKTGSLKLHKKQTDWLRSNEYDAYDIRNRGSLTRSQFYRVKKFSNRIVRCINKIANNPYYLMVREMESLISDVLEDEKN